MNTSGTKTVKLRLEGVSVVRPRAANPQVLEAIDLEVFEGEALAVVGPSGAGKSTLLRVMNDLEAVSAGRILLDGVPIADLAPHLLRRRVGLVFQVPRALCRSVADDLSYGPRAAGRTPTRDALRLALERVGLDAAHLDRSMDHLSVGEQQRVALARALMNEPEVLLLDEPTSALDPANAQALLALLGALKRATTAGGRLTIVFVTHSLEQARALGDRVALLQGGKLLEVATAERFFSEEAGPETRAFLESGKAPG
jgi:putative ABC transport system ATP-binding protein